MRSVLNYVSLSVLLYACNGRTEQVVDKNTSLYPPPLSYKLNVSGGYSINQLTGDSVKSLINSFGDTVITGITFPLKGVIADPETLEAPATTKVISPRKQIIKNNIHPLPGKLVITPVDTTKLKKIGLGEGDQSHIIQNSTGVFATGVPIPLVGNAMPFHEPIPAKALPLRSKDGATVHVQYLDVDQGMSFSFVMKALEDRKGNFWFAMDGTGLSRYDGVSFSHFTTKQGLNDNVVRDIIEDKRGHIWVGTVGGVAMFDGEKFTQFTVKQGLPDNRVFKLYEDKKGNIWFCNPYKGVSKYDGKMVTHYTMKEGLPSDMIYDCIEDRKGNIWFATSAGAVMFDGKSFTNYTRGDGLTSDYINDLLEDRNGNIWIGTNNGINKYDGKKITQYTTKEGLSSNITWSVFEDKKGNIWIGTSYGGINKFDGNSFTHYSLSQGISNSKIRAITEDGNGNIWFGTDGGGVNKLNDQGFEYLIPDEAFANNRIRPIIKDRKGNVWLGTEGGGIGKFNTDHSFAAGNEFSYYGKNEGLKELGQRIIYEDKAGNIWIGESGAGLSKFDGTGFTNYSQQNGISGSSIFSLLEDRNKNLWIGTRVGGINKFDGKVFTHYTEKEGLSGSAVFSILQDQKGNLWFGNENGVSKYDGTHLINYTEKEGLFGKTVTSILEDKDGNLWFGTLGGGVCKFDENSFTYYTEKEGLSNNNVWSITQDSAANIWAGTDKGLNLFIKSEKKSSESNGGYSIYNFGLQDGLKATDFNLHSVSIDNNNRIWWGSGKGVVSLDLNNPFQLYPLRSLQLKYVEINDRFYDYRNFPDSLRKKIRFSNVLPFFNYPVNLSLPHDQNHLTFHFSAIDWSAPHKIKYSYRLIGLDETWSTPTEEPVVDYRNLGHGSYQFQLKAIGQLQEWTLPFTYDFVIRPAWWQTWLFKLFIVLGAVALLLFISRLIYLSRLRKQKVLMEKELAVQLERQRISSEMHDDIGAGLSGVRLLTEITRSKIKNTDASSEMDKIYESVGEISVKMKEVIWSLNTENDDIASLIAFIQKQTRAMLEYYPCELLMDIPSSFPLIDISGEARRNIYLTVKELLHNIIKHSGADKIKLSITCSEKLVITISDNGKGFSSAAVANSGNGLKNIKQRMEKLNGSFVIQNHEGTTIILEIPLKINT